MPFDRLVRTVDQWAVVRGRKDVFAQIGRTDYRPSHIEWTPFLDPHEYKRCYRTAKAIVAHAGTGSIITALQLGKPILIMPRRVSMRETRNDHQVATAEWVRRFRSVVVAQDEEELLEKLEEVDDLEGRQVVGPHASKDLMAAIREFIDGVATGRL
jgi:UDP-N-acetylglucosamine transferase subunit ALG13